MNEQNGTVVIETPAQAPAVEVAPVQPEVAEAPKAPETPVVIESPKVSKPKAKAKAKKVEKKDGRGRPAIYTGALARKIASLIRKHGITGTRKVLAKEGLPQAEGRNKKYKVSMPTLIKIGQKAGITLKRGRPAA